MSNMVVGNVYQQIIEKVIASSQNDFEEFGVDTATLEEMKQGWQEKLTALRVASFPWDPQPQSQSQPTVVPSNVKPENELMAPVSASSETHHPNFPNVKNERGYDPPMASYPQAPVNTGYTGGYNGDIAQQRAQALVQQRLQGQGNMPHPQQHGGQIPPQQQQQQQQYQQQQQQQQRMMAQQQQQQQQQQQRPPQAMQQRPAQGHVYQSQTDGASDLSEDWKSLVAVRASDTEEDRLAADQFMRAHVDAMAADQDSGLMMPLSKIPKGKKRKAADRVRQAQITEASSSSTSVPGPARFDGDDDEKENDSDAINSDLDDPDDDAINGDDSDDETMDYMLCTYDKVQRVKNKWKCTLKDGILTTNKKEYLFHKANGEFEW